MWAFNRLLCAVALVLFAFPAMAQNKVPPDRALEALVKATLLTKDGAVVHPGFTAQGDAASAA